MADRTVVSYGVTQKRCFVHRWPQFKTVESYMELLRDECPNGGLVARRKPVNSTLANRQIGPEHFVLHKSRFLYVPMCSKTRTIKNLDTYSWIERSKHYIARDEFRNAQKCLRSTSIHVNICLARNLEKGPKSKSILSVDVASPR